MAPPSRRATSGCAPGSEGSVRLHIHNAGAVPEAVRASFFEKYATSGNIGMLDIVAMLEWVRDNISNFGGDPTLIIAPGNAALVRFDLTSIPAGTTVAKVYLRVFAGKLTTPGTLSFALVTSPWSETGVTLIAQPTVGTAFASSPVSVANSFVLVDVTAQAQNWLANPATNFGVEIAGIGPTVVALDSKENPATSHPYYWAPFILVGDSDNSFLATFGTSR